MDLFIKFSETQKSLMVIPKINGEFNIPSVKNSYVFVGYLTKEQYQYFLLWQSRQKDLNLKKVKSAVKKYSKLESKL